MKHFSNFLLFLTLCTLTVLIDNFMEIQNYIYNNMSL